MAEQYTIPQGLEWSVEEQNRDIWLLLIDGTPFAVRLERDYGAGPYPILWSAYLVAYANEQPMLNASLGSFHHAAHSPNDHLAGVVWSTYQARVDREAHAANEDAEEANV